MLVVVAIAGVVPPNIIGVVVSAGAPNGLVPAPNAAAGVIAKVGVVVEIVLPKAGGCVALAFPNIFELGTDPKQILVELIWKPVLVTVGALEIDVVV